VKGLTNIGLEESLIIDGGEMYRGTMMQPRRSVPIDILATSSNEKLGEHVKNLFTPRKFPIGAAIDRVMMMHSRNIIRRIQFVLCNDCWACRFVGADVAIFSSNIFVDIPAIMMVRIVC
jgi:hypothetical protein